MPTETFSDLQDEFEAQTEKAEAFNAIIKRLADASARGEINHE
jgi:hypothetical protein